MKKTWKLNFIFLALTICVSAHSQIFKNVGVSGGVTFSKLMWNLRANSFSSEEHLETDYGIGYFAQVNSDVLERKHMNLNVALGVIQKHGDYSESYYFGNNFITVNSPHKLTYISFTSVVRGKIHIGKSFLIYGSLGPRVDYLIDYTDNITKFMPNGGSYFYYADEDLQHFNFGLNAGLGIRYNIGKISLGIEGSRNLNANKIFSAKGPRLDGYGDEGFYLNLNDRTYIVNLQFSFKI